MALDVTLEDVWTGADINSGAPFTTPSFTPPDDSILIIDAGFVAAPGGGEGADLGISSTPSLTWTVVETSRNNPTWGGGRRAWAAKIGTGVSMTVTVTMASPFVGHDYQIARFAVTGADEDVPIGGTAEDIDTDGEDDLPLTLSSAPAESSVVIGSLVTVANAGSMSAAPGTGFTLLSATGMPHVVGGWGGMFAQIRTGSTSDQAGWGDISSAGSDGYASMAIAYEIRAASTGSVFNPLTGRGGSAAQPLAA